ncbi:MAG: hypothetical protein SFZ02_06295, partial [bacterium]|nr:hypothetical protein [bacterium]
PVPAPKSDEPDPNDPEDIRHAIPIYGADHWYVKHYLAFVKLLREVIPNQDSMVNHEVSAEGLRLIGKPIWKEFPSGASAITALKAKLGIKDTPTPPVTTPKPAPVPVPTPQPEVSTNWQKEFAQWLWDFLDIASIEQYEVMSGKQVSDYATLKDATEDATSIAQAKQWTICSYRATYVKKGEKTTYIEFQGLFPVRMYGRSSTFKTQVGEGYYTANGVDKWEANQTYKIEGLRVRWQYDQNRIAIASKVEPIQYELDEPPLDLTPEELEAMAKVDI